MTKSHLELILMKHNIVSGVLFDKKNSSIYASLFSVYVEKRWFLVVSRPLLANGHSQYLWFQFLTNNLSQHMLSTADVYSWAGLSRWKQQNSDDRWDLFFFLGFFPLAYHLVSFRWLIIYLDWQKTWFSWVTYACHCLSHYNFIIVGFFSVYWYSFLPQLVSALPKQMLKKLWIPWNMQIVRGTSKIKQ